MTTPTVPPALPTSAPEPSAVEASWLKSEELLGEVSSVRGAAEVGPVSSKTGHVVIYVKCYGTGIVTVELVGSAVFDQRCLTDADDPGTRNQIQALTPDEVIVRASADNADLWAIAVTEGDVD